MLHCVVAGLELLKLFGELFNVLILLANVELDSSDLLTEHVTSTHRANSRVSTGWLSSGIVLRNNTSLLLDEASDFMRFELEHVDLLNEKYVFFKNTFAFLGVIFGLV